VVLVYFFYNAGLAAGDTTGLTAGDATGVNVTTGVVVAAGDGANVTTGDGDPTVGVLVAAGDADGAGASPAVQAVIANTKAIAISTINAFFIKSYSFFSDDSRDNYTRLLHHYISIGI